MRSTSFTFKLRIRKKPTSLAGANTFISLLFIVDDMNDGILHGTFEGARTSGCGCSIVPIVTNGKSMQDSGVATIEDGGGDSVLVMFVR